MPCHSLVEVELRKGDLGLIVAQQALLVWRAQPGSFSAAQAMLSMPSRAPFMTAFSAGDVVAKTTTAVP
jgi:hypothetical protein